MSLTRIDYKTSKLTIMDEKENGQRLVLANELVLPLVTSSSPTVKGKTGKKINNESRSVTKVIMAQC
jgi:hypothetical protein